MSRRIKKSPQPSVPQRMVLGKNAKEADLKRAKKLAAAALQDTPLFDALADRFYNDDIYAALDFIAADRMNDEIYKRHGDMLECFLDRYDEVATELAFAAFMLGVAMMAPRGLASVELEEGEATPAKG